MACLADEFSVGAIQGEELGVVEVAHTVDAVVTIQAGEAELVGMLIHEGKILVTI